MPSETKSEIVEVVQGEKSKTPKKKSVSKSNNEKKLNSKPDRGSSAKSNLRIDLDNWLGQIAAGRSLDAVHNEISKLPKDSHGIALEFFSALSNSESKPSGKFKIDKFSVSSILKVAEKFKNSYFLAALITAENLSSQNRKLFIDLFFMTDFTEDKMDYLLNRTGNVKDQHAGSQIWEAILDNPGMQKSGWESTQLKVLDWGFSQGYILRDSRHSFESWHAASAQFKLLETPAKNRFYRKLLDLDSVLFWNFLIHIARDSISEKFLEPILGQKNYEVMLSYFDNRSSISGSWSTQFEGKVIAPLLKTTIDQIMEIEQLLRLLPNMQHFSQLLPAETLPRAIRRCYNKGDDLAQLFSDPRVGTLELSLKESTENAKKLLDENSIQGSKLKEFESRIRDFESAMANYESRLRSQMNTESAGNSAVIQQGRVELMKSLLEGIDHILNSENGIMLERALQKFGVSKLGAVNETYAWNNENCESLTGAALESGLVVRCGYTWADGDKKTLIRRVLLKNT